MFFSQMVLANREQLADAWALTACSSFACAITLPIHSADRMLFLRVVLLCHTALALNIEVPDCSFYWLFQGFHVSSVVR